MRIIPLAPTKPHTPFGFGRRPVPPVDVPSTHRVGQQSTSRFVQQACRQKLILFLRSARLRYLPQTWQQQTPSDYFPATRTEGARKRVKETEPRETLPG